MESILHIAIIGSGPSGFYAAEELLIQNSFKVYVDMFDRLPTPFGLVRGGVAPDHQKIKSVVNVYNKTASRDGFRFFGSVEFGKDLFLEDLKKNYHAVIFAVGAKSDRPMDIPGERLKGCHPATDFVGWYNAHPDYRHLSFDLSCERAAVIGNGNVAMDVTRILACEPSHLAGTDIADYALETLKKSQIKEIYLLGRRGPAQAAFSNPEIRELCHLHGAHLLVDPREAELDPLSKETFEALTPTAKHNVQILQEECQKAVWHTPLKKIIVRFLVSPVEVIGKEGKAAGLKIEKNVLHKDKDGSLRAKGTGQFETLDVGLILPSIGYKGVPLPGLPYDDRKGIIPNEMGRVMDPQSKKVIPGLYVVGWAKRGPTGVIGTNKPDSIDTVKKMLEDFQAAQISLPNSINSNSILKTLEDKKFPFTNFADWQFLDRLEIEKGQSKGKIREKFISVDEMITAIKNATRSTAV